LEKALLRYAITIFLSAFLLFQVQPLISKYILPWFGGGPSVWTTCMLFFQMVLLAGYAYAHYVSTRLSQHKQVVMHLALLVAAVALLPIRPDASWKPSPTDDPTWRIAALLAVTVGLPYFILSTSSPILSAWFHLTNPGRSPYRLYSLSNAGSLLALISYPFVVEPELTLGYQAWAWSGGFIFFALMCGMCALGTWHAKSGSHATAQPEATATPGSPPAPPSIGLRLLWLLLAATASTMLLAVTNQMCQDVAVVPFLWVLPLGLYLVTFIICFDNERWYFRPVFWPLMAAAIVGMCWILYRDAEATILQQIGILAAGLFACCMVCHGELVRLKPHPRHLTSFYLMVSAGGALGGVFVTLIAPRVFTAFLELHIAIWLCAGLAALAWWYGNRETSVTRSAKWAFGAVALVAWIGLGVVLANLGNDTVSGYTHMSRNFYGILRVCEQDTYDPGRRRFVLLHGRINHGWQFAAPEKQNIPTSYYAPDSGIGMALRLHRANMPKRVGVLGLGAGNVAAYGRPGDSFRFYEINPRVEELHKILFTCLMVSEAKCNIVMGDGRLSLEREEPQGFDVLMMDAFSGDAVPVHLLTREAFEIYLRHMQPDGLIAVNITNRHLNLAPVVRGIAEHFGLKCVRVEFEEDKLAVLNACSWMIVGNDPAFFSHPEVLAAAESGQGKPTIMWTDDYSNLFRILKF
jgi:hypothetical protein